MPKVAAEPKVSPDTRETIPGGDLWVPKTYATRRYS